MYHPSPPSVGSTGYTPHEQLQEGMEKSFSQCILVPDHPLWLLSLSSKCKTGHIPHEWLQERMEKVGVTSVFMSCFEKEVFKFLWSVHGNMETGSFFVFCFWLALGEKGERDGGMEVSPYLSGLSCLLFQFKQLNTGWGRRLVQNPSPTWKYFSTAFFRMFCLVSQ